MRRRVTALVLASLATVLGCGFPETSRNALFPPDDLYDALGEVQIDLSDSGRRFGVDVIHKYPGTHAVSIEVPVTQAYEFPLRADFSLDLTVQEGGATILERHVNDLLHPFRGGDVGGYDLVYYEVPNDLPRNVQVTVTLIVTKPDPEFSARFDSIKMSVAKIPDL